MTSLKQPTGSKHNRSAPTVASTMQAIMQDRYGSADQLRLDLTARPVIADTEVLVRVKAAGLDRGTWHLMTGRPYLLRLVMGLRGPRNRVPGLDVAGTVVEVGSMATRFAVGDEVFGIGRGSFAEYTRAREDKLAHKPAGVSSEQAAVTAVSAVTALQALRDAGHVKKNDKVLIIGASGGVGSFAVQLAKAFGAEVTGVCSATKGDLVRSLGADHVIDYTQNDFADGAERYDLILDIGGNASLSRLRRALTRTGTAVIVGGENAGNLTGMRRQLRALIVSPFVSQRLTMVTSMQRLGDLEQLAEFLEAGTITPSIDRSFPLGQVPEAMRHLEAGKARGKVVITV
jgi:NADPH:quinone reductase-like Zn-dependent oxidoreductase